MKAGRRFWTDCLHIFVLWGFAAAQPLYDLLGQNAEFFVAHRAGAGTIILFALGLSLAAPMVLVLIEAAAAAIYQPSQKVIHYVFVCILVVLTVVPPLNRLEILPTILILGTAAIAGIGFTLAYPKFGAVGSFLTFASPAIIIFPVYLMFFTPVSQIVLPKRDKGHVSARVETQVPIILIVFDEFSTSSLLGRDGKIDRVKFPNFAFLADRAYWFPNATTVHHSTTISVPTVLTGRYPTEWEPLPTAATYPQNLFTILAPSYRMNVHEIVTDLCPQEVCKNNKSKWSDGKQLYSDLLVVYLHLVTPSNLRTALPILTAGWRGFGQERSAAQPDDDAKAAQSLIDRIAERERLKRLIDPFLEKVRTGRHFRFVDFIESSSQSSGNTLNFIHLMLPHHPWHYLPSGRMYRAPGLTDGFIQSKGSNDWLPHEELARLGFQRYLLQVGFLDQMVGDLISALELGGIFDEALIILTADHGVSFQAGGPLRGITRENFWEILPIPMFVKLPGQKNGIESERHVTNVDILPTILDVLGIEEDLDLDGISMIGSRFPDRDEITIRGNDKNLTFSADQVAPRHYDIVAGEFVADLRQKAIFPELHGRYLLEFDIGPAPEFSIEVDQVADFSVPVSEDSRFLPVYLSGRVVADGSLANPVRLGFAMNDQIVATASTIPDWQGGKEFRVVLPERSFTLGHNDLSIFAIINDTTRTPVLLATENVFRGLQLVVSDGHERILDGRGAEIVIRKDGVRGHIEMMTPIERYGRTGLSLAGAGSSKRRR